MNQMKNQGFTLIELLVVVAILAILSIVVFVVINPPEILRQGHDVTRLSDLQNLKQAITVALTEGTGSNLLCAGEVSCSARSNPNSVAKKMSDGTGWVKINLKDLKSLSLPTLPLDPVNSDVYHYTYCADVVSGTQVWEISTVLESKNMSPKMLNSSDGGNEDDKYEIGSSLTVIAPEGQGNCTY